MVERGDRISNRRMWRVTGGLGMGRRGGVMECIYFLVSVKISSLINRDVALTLFLSR
jgi:hypothetical protein